MKNGGAADNRRIAIENKEPKYIGRECPKCYTNIKYTRNRGCVKCELKYGKEKRDETRHGAGRETYLKERREYYSKNTFEINRRERTYSLKNIEKRLFSQSKKRAKKNNQEHSIEIGDIFVPSHCPILNILLSVGVGGVHAGSPTLDRIDNTKGYLKGNVHVISHRANASKSDLTLEELVLMGKWASKRLKKSK